MATKYKHFQLSQKVVFYKPETKEFLLLKLNPDKDPAFYRDFGPWDLPGGRTHTFEDEKEALGRELKEEIGDPKYTMKSVFSAITIDVPEKGETPHRAVFFSLAEFQSGEIVLSDEHVEFVWKKREDIEKDKECRPWIQEAIQKAWERLESEEYLSGWQRTQADFENYKKRQASENTELGRYMINTVVAELVPILDNFNAAVHHVPESEKKSPWVTGITYIEKQFEEVLGKYGVKTMEVKVGEKFDPQKHEAIGHAEKEGGEELVIEKVLQKGYLMGDKVIKAARVNVTSK